MMIAPISALILGVWRGARVAKCNITLAQAEVHCELYQAARHVHVATCNAIA